MLVLFWDILEKILNLFFNKTEKNPHTNSLDDGILDDALFTLFSTAGWNTGAGVSPRGLAKLKVNAHPQVFEQSVEHLQHSGTCNHTHTDT